MTRERAKELLPVIQAFAEGKVIEMHIGESNEWESICEPNFFDGRQYRIKPKPRQWWLVTSREGSVVHSAHSDRETAHAGPAESLGCKIIHVREVL